MQVKGKFLDCGEFIKLSFTWADALWTVIWPFPLTAVKEKLFMALAEDGREDFTQVGTTLTGTGAMAVGFCSWGERFSSTLNAA